MDYPSTLLKQADNLKAESQLVVADLELYKSLSTIGELKQIGSSVTGLLVWRDKDFAVTCPGALKEDVIKSLIPLLCSERISQIKFNNETGEFNPTGLPQDERVYVAANYKMNNGNVWKLDISFWMKVQQEQESQYVEHIRKHLTADTRLAILWIKDIWHRKPAYYNQVCSMDIYTAVLDHSVRTPQDFDAYLAKRKQGF